MIAATAAPIFHRSPPIHTKIMTRMVLPSKCRSVDRGYPPDPVIGDRGLGVRIGHVGLTGCNATCFPLGQVVFAGRIPG